MVWFPSTCVLLEPRLLPARKCYRLLLCGLQTAVEGQEAQLCANAAETQLESEDYFSVAAVLRFSCVVAPCSVLLLASNKEFLYRTAYAAVALLGVFVR